MCCLRFTHHPLLVQYPLHAQLYSMRCSYSCWRYIFIYFFFCHLIKTSRIMRIMCRYPCNFTTHNNSANVNMLFWSYVRLTCSFRSNSVRLIYLVLFALIMVHAIPKILSKIISLPGYWCLSILVHFMQFLINDKTKMNI